VAIVKLCCCKLFMALLFFFFQAEDGIRDRNVTGVQTCALPISAKDDFAQIWASRASWKRWNGECSFGRLYTSAGKHLFYTPITQRLLATRTAGHPATKGGKLP